MPDESFTESVAFCVFTLIVSRLLNVALKSADSVNSSGSSDPNNRSVRRFAASISSAVTGWDLSFLGLASFPPSAFSPFGLGAWANDTALKDVSAMRAKSDSDRE